MDDAAAELLLYGSLLNMWDWNPAGVWHPWRGYIPNGIFHPKFLGFLNHSSRYRSIFHRSSMWTSSLMCLWPVTGCMCFFFSFGPGLVSVLLFWWTIEPLLLWFSLDQDVFFTTLWSPRSPLFVGEKSKNTRRVGMPAPVRGPKEFCSFK